VFDTPSKRTVAAWLLACTLAALAASGCSNPPLSNDASTSTAPALDASSLTKDERLAALVPPRIRDKGTVTVATNAPYPPFVSFDSSQRIIGLEPDLAAAVGKVLDLRFEFAQQPFEGLVAGLSAGKYDVLMAGLEDTRERQQTVTMVDYLYDGDGLLTATGNPQKISDAKSVCGKTMAVQTGATQGTTLEQLSAQCVSSGAAPIEVKRYNSMGDVQMSLSSGGVAGILTTYTNALTLVKDNPQLEIIENADPFGRGDVSRAVVGLAVRKSEPAMAQAMSGAIQQLMDNGYYTQLVTNYNLEKLAATKSTIDGGTNESG
jgi:polar amino acid transport system substrate-binding protein